MMKYYFCLVPSEDDKPMNMGYKYIKDHESEWIEGNSDIYNYLTAGYVKGVDFVVVDDKAYMLWKSYIIPANDAVVILAKESNQGADIMDFSKNMAYIESKKQTALVTKKKDSDEDDNTENNQNTDDPGNGGE